MKPSPAKAFSAKTAKNPTAKICASCFFFEPDASRIIQNGRAPTVVSKRARFKHQGLRKQFERASSPGRKPDLGDQLAARRGRESWAIRTTEGRFKKGCALCFIVQATSSYAHAKQRRRTEEEVLIFSVALDKAICRLSPV